MVSLQRTGIASILIVATFITLIRVPIHATSSGPAGQTVMMVNFQFTPKTLVVPVGTTVTWTNADTTLHTATSDTGVFNTGNVAPGQSQSFTFNSAGSFPYHCIYHGAPGGIGMSGTIIVIPPVGYLPFIATP